MPTIQSSKPQFRHVIGIVGGAGPVASSSLYSSLLEVCQRRYDANDYSDFPEIILISYPFTRGNKEKNQQEITLCLSKLKAAGASLFCLASHSLHGSIQHAPIGFVDLIQEVIFEIQRQGMQKVLILAAPKTIELKLYQQLGLKCVYPLEKEQKRINECIRQVASGKIERELSTILKEIISSSQKQEAFDGVILACTELPMIHRILPVSNTVPVIDTLYLLAERLIEKAILTS